MAYRRKQPIARASTFSHSPEDHRPGGGEDSAPSSLAAQAIRASSAHRDSSLSYAYGESAYRDSSRQKLSPSTQRQDASTPYEYTSMRSIDESKYGFWGVLARKAKSVLEDDKMPKQSETPSYRPSRPQMLETPRGGQFQDSFCSPDGIQKSPSPKIQKGLEAITSSLNYIGGTIGNALEEGLTIVENRTADIISDARKLHLRRKGPTDSPDASHRDQAAGFSGLHQPAQTKIQADQETQLKASRDVAMAMAAKAKLLLRELKTVKADLAFAKRRCAQLEEENKILRESREKGDSPEDDDLIRLQLETLLAEKARLAHENSIYARENRFLREIVEYHQLTMQDVVYVDEGHEEVSEVYPIPLPPVVDLHTVVPTTPPGADIPCPASSSATIISPSPSVLDPGIASGPQTSDVGASSVSQSFKRQNSISSA